MQYTLGSIPTMIQQSSASGGTLQNAGPAPVIVSEDSSGGAGFIIASGASAHIDAGTLWCYCPTGTAIVYTSSSVGVPSTVVPNYGLNTLTSGNAAGGLYDSGWFDIYNYVTIGITISPVVLSGLVSFNDYSTDDQIIIDMGDGTDVWSSSTYLYCYLSRKTIYATPTAPQMRLRIIPGVKKNQKGVNVGIATEAAVKVTGYGLAINNPNSAFIDDYSMIDMTPTTKTANQSYPVPGNAVYTCRFNSSSHADHPASFNASQALRIDQSAYVAPNASIYSYVVIPLTAMGNVIQVPVVSTYGNGTNDGTSYTYRPAGVTALGYITGQTGNRTPVGSYQSVFQAPFFNLVVNAGTSSLTGKTVNCGTQSPYMLFSSNTTTANATMPSMYCVQTPPTQESY